MQSAHATYADTIEDEIDRGGVPTGESVAVGDVDERDALAADEEVVHRPFHRLLAGLVPVDRHRRQRRRGC